jgi:hypothetical protein
MSGIMSVNGEPEGEPLKTGGPGVDIFAGVRVGPRPFLLLRLVEE